MSLTPGEMVIYGGVVALSYGAIANRWLAFGGGQRDIVIELGAYLLEDPKTPKDIKEKIRESQKLVMSRRVAWFMALSVVPFAIWALTQTPKSELRLRWRDRPRCHYENILTAYAQAWILSVLSNSPIAAVLYAVQMMVVSLVVWPQVIILRYVRNTSDHSGWWTSWWLGGEAIRISSAASKAAARGKNRPMTGSP